MAGPVGPIGPMGPTADSTDVDNLVAASKAGNLDAPTALALAHVSSDPSDTVTNAQALSSVTKTAKLANTLGQLDPQTQANVHASLTADVTNRLTNVGYAPPIGPEGPVVPKAKPAPGGGIFHDIVGGVIGGFKQATHGAERGLGDALRPVGAIVPSAVRSATHEVLGGVNDAAAIFPHAFRTAEAIGEANNPGFMSHGLLGGLTSNMKTLSMNPLSLSSWAKAWKETANGATTFDPAVVRTMRAKYSDQAFQLIQQVVEGADPAKIAQQSGAEGPKILQAVKSPEFQQAVTQLSNSRMSLGRLLVGEDMLNNHPAEAHAISGMADGLSDLYNNPIVLGSAVKNASTWARYSLDANDIQSMYVAGSKGGAIAGAKGVISGTNNIARYFDQAAKVANKGGPAALATWDPKIAPLLEDLKPMFKNAKDQGRELTGKDFARAVSGQQGTIALLSGRAGRYFHGTTMVPHLSALGSALKAGKLMMGKAVNWGADLGKITSDLAPGYEARAAAEQKGIPYLTGSSTARMDSEAPTYIARDLVSDAGKIKRGLAFGPRVLARQVQAMGRLMPTASYVIDGSPVAAQNISRLAKVFLPTARANDYMNMWTMGNQAQRFSLVKGLAAEIFDAAGAYSNPFVNDFAQSWLQMMDDEEERSRFLSSGRDVINEGNGSYHAGVTEQDMSDRFRLPEWRSIQFVAKKGAVMGALRAGLGSAADLATGIWKGLVIVRPGFAIRAGGEELVGAIVRNGLSPVIKSYAARSALDLRFDQSTLTRYNALSRVMQRAVQRSMEKGLFKDIQEARTQGLDPSIDLHLPPRGSLISHEPWRDAARILSEHVIPKPILDHIQSPAEHIGAWFAYGPKAVVKVVKAGERAIAGQEYLSAMKLWVEQGNGADSFNDFISSVRQPEGGWGTATDSASDLARMGMPSSKIELRPGNKYTMTGNQDEYFNQKWASRINYLAQSQLIQKVWEHADESLAVQRREVSKLLQSDEMAKIREASPRSRLVPDPNGGPARRVGVDATQKEAIDDWTEKIIEQANDVIRKDKKLVPLGKGTLLDQIRGGQIDAKTLDKIPRGDKPEAVIGPEMIPYHENWIHAAMTKSMETVVGRPMDWLSRQPIFLSNYATAVAEARRILTPKFWDDALTEEENTTKIDKLVNDVASQRAVNETLPYIHDIRSRTQFEQMHRRLAPFLFAQRQFYARWLKNLVHSPQAIARFGTVMNGLRVSGFIHNDPQTGQATFTYPMSGALTNVALRTLNQLPGINIQLNVPSDFTGEVSGLSPGLTSSVPGASFLVSTGFDALATLHPGLAPFANVLSGGTLADSPSKLSDLLQNTASSVLPSVATRFMASLGLTTTGREEIASNTINAMAYLEAAGHGLPENASPSEKALYVSRLQTMTTSLSLLRTMFGFFAPATPTLKQDSLHLDGEYQKLLSIMPYDQAVLAFTTAYPDGLPYTVGKTASLGGAQLATTAPGLAYLNAHRQFLENYKMAGPWLIPQSNKADPYDQAAESEQLMLGLRQQRDPMVDIGDTSSWYSELVYARDSTTYFDQEQAYVKASNVTNLSYAKRTADKQLWVNWSNAYLTTHPALKTVMVGGVPTSRRDDVMTEMDKVVNDPTAPASPTLSGIKVLMQQWHLYEQAISHFTNDTTTTNATALWNATNEFINYGDQYVAANPAAKTFWAGVLQYAVKW